MQWISTTIGNGAVDRTDDSFRLTIPRVSGSHYHDSQITNYYPISKEFATVPPISLHIRAKFAGDLHGTAGFGFWNHPMAPNERGFRLPQAIWFFYGSPPNNMALANDVPGYGWKAATFDARRWQFLALLPFALPGFLLMRIPFLYRKLWWIGQRAIGVSETLLDPALPDALHDYRIDWLKDGARFYVDGELVHETQQVPRGALGVIVWIDNQYAIVTPQGNFGAGVVDVPDEQSLIIEHIELSRID